MNSTHLFARTRSWLHHVAALSLRRQGRGKPTPLQRLCRREFIRPAVGSLVTLFAAGLLTPTGAAGQHRNCTLQAPLQAQLLTVKKPLPGKPVELTLSILPQEPLVNAELSWDLDPGVERVRDGKSQGGLVLPANVRTQFPITVRFPRNGEFRVSASLIERRTSSTFGRRVSLYFTVTDKEIKVSPLHSWHETPQNRTAQRAGPKEVITLPQYPPHLLTAVVPPLNEPFTDDPPDNNPHVQGGGVASVRGYLYYRHHDGTLHPAWNSSVQIWDRDTFSGDDLLAVASIRSDGFFNSGDFNNSDDGDPFDGSAQDVYVLFAASNGRVNVMDYDNVTTVKIGGPNLGDNIHDGIYNIGSQVVDGDGPGTYPDDSWEAAFEICETASLGWLHYNALGNDLPLVNIRWKPGGSDGAYYEGELARISLSDGDQMDPSVILHEYGHHVMWAVKGGRPPGAGGDHTWSGCYNGGKAWSEGWATYSGQSTLGVPIYRDSYGANASNIYEINIERETGSCPDATVGTLTESSVACCLWDMYDGLAGDEQTHDYAALGTTAIWDTFRNNGASNHMKDFLYAFMGRYPAYIGYTRWWASDHHITLTNVPANRLYVDKAYSGPEFGTPAQPFRTVGAALTAAVPDTSTEIYVRAANYNELPDITKLVDIYNWGETGVVNIGPL